MKQSVMENFWSRVGTPNEDGCLPWTGYLDRKGYGRLKVGNRKEAMAHRVAYELANGRIPEGLTIDHLCRNHRCVNAEHLEAVTNKVNVLRGSGPSAKNARKTHCDHGHALTEENIYRYGSIRKCRACHYIRCLTWRRRERAKALVPEARP
jgi:hypothetical protein